MIVNVWRAHLPRAIVVSDNSNTCNATEWNCKQNANQKSQWCSYQVGSTAEPNLVVLVVIVCPTATFEGGGGSVR
jgi:hypothetical protein